MRLTERVASIHADRIYSYLETRTTCDEHTDVLAFGEPAKVELLELPTKPLHGTRHRTSTPSSLRRLILLGPSRNPSSRAVEKVECAVM